MLNLFLILCLVLAVFIYKWWEERSLRKVYEEVKAERRKKINELLGEISKLTARVEGNEGRLKRYRIELRGKSRKYYAVIIHKNGNVILQSSEFYNNKKDAETAAKNAMGL